MRNDYRHELKHEISYGDMLLLQKRLPAVMQPDSHARDGTYFIRSLYFDTPGDRALCEKLDGVNKREKYRIRFYDHDPGFIRLEKKSRLNGLGTKDTAPLTKEEVLSIAGGDISWMAESDRPLLRELYTVMRTTLLAPKTIVDYTRRPFIYPAGNVRVTLDYNIRTGLCSKELFDPDLPTIPVQNDPVILEVKWDGFLPDVIRRIVAIETTQQAYSKYAACRMYD